MHHTWVEPVRYLRRGCGLWVLLCVFAACSGEQSIRASGDLCQSDGQCGSNLCYDELCLEPSLDDDGDGLINQLEAQLGTNSQLADSDGDGVIDSIEVGVNPAEPLDEDGDSKIDAIESNLPGADADDDCIPDQKDGDDAVQAPDVSKLANTICCCGGPCDEPPHNRESIVASCGLVNGEKVLLCEPAPIDSDDDGREDLCDNCPEVSNLSQRDDDQDGLGNPCDVCPQDPDNDEDEDGICALEDTCPDIYDPRQIDTDGDALTGTGESGASVGGDLCDDDDDNDGVPDLSDNCPLVFNPDQLDLDDDDLGAACDDDDTDSDVDLDGVVDGVDNCPKVSNPEQEDFDSDGIGALCDSCFDPDEDLLCGQDDNCPREFNPDQADNDADGLGDLCDEDDTNTDFDGDGILDGQDNCPQSFNAEQYDLDGDGEGDACDLDADGDGAPLGVDCAPLDKDIAPGVKERCNDLDDDCDDAIDEDFSTLGEPCQAPEALDSPCMTSVFACETGGAVACIGSSPLADGTACSDSDACTTDDQCLSGVCQGAVTVCDDDNPCTVDVCDSESGACTFVVDDSGSCPPGENPCLNQPTCNAGQCEPGPPVICDDDDPCTVDVCDIEVGACTFTALECLDPDACTSSVCVDGACEDSALTCDDDDPCTSDSCEIDEGGCVHIALDCQPPDACSTSVCVDGQCVVAPLDCDDGDPCTLDICAADGDGCVNTAQPDGFVCGEAIDACLVPVCQAGACVEAPLDCDDANACTTDSCSPDSGCQHDVLVCEAPSNPCLTAQCEPSLGLCQEVPYIGATCDDGDLCTASDTCDAQGTCVGVAFCDDDNACTDDLCEQGLCSHNPLDCSGGSPCVSPTCDPTTGCTKEAINEGVACDDGYDCTPADTCTFGFCKGELLGVCGCTVDADCAVFIDNDPCSPIPTCTEGVCIELGVTDCDDGDPCTTEYCSSALGGCVYENADSPSCGSSCTPALTRLNQGSQGAALLVDMVSVDRGETRDVYQLRQEPSTSTSTPPYIERIRLQPDGSAEVSLPTLLSPNSASISPTSTSFTLGYELLVTRDGPDDTPYLWVRHSNGLIAFDISDGASLVPVYTATMSQTASTMNMAEAPHAGVWLAEVQSGLPLSISHHVVPGAESGEAGDTPPASLPDLMDKDVLYDFIVLSATHVTVSSGMALHDIRWDNYPAVDWSETHILQYEATATGDAVAFQDTIPGLAEMTAQHQLFTLEVCGSAGCESQAMAPWSLLYRLQQTESDEGIFLPLWGQFFSFDTMVLEGNLMPQTAFAEGERVYFALSGLGLLIADVSPDLTSLELKATYAETYPDDFNAFGFFQQPVAMETWGDLLLVGRREGGLSVYQVGCGQDADHDGVEDALDCAPFHPFRAPGAAELCNGFDDDCDTEIDEGVSITFNGQTLIPGEPCGLGACAGGVVKCAEVPLGVEGGMSGALSGVLVGDPYCDLPATASEEDSCDGVDEDCDGLVDETFAFEGVTVGQACGVGACAGGVVTCLGDGITAGCSSDGASVDELCDGIDNDCDSKVDEAFAIGQPCTVGQGACIATGLTACSGPNMVTCDAVAGSPPGDDSLCDGVDDDCDGAIDEDAVCLDDCLSGQACLEGACVGGEPTGDCPCDDLSDCAPFEDGDACNGVLACSVDGQCILEPESIVQCGELGPCLTSSCNATTGACVPQPKLDGLSCATGCALTAQCDSGQCVGVGTLSPTCGVNCLPRVIDAQRLEGVNDQPVIVTDIATLDEAVFLVDEGDRVFKLVRDLQSVEMSWTVDATFDLSSTLTVNSSGLTAIASGQAGTYVADNEVLYHVEPDGLATEVSPLTDTLHGGAPIAAGPTHLQVSAQGNVYALFGSTLAVVQMGAAESGPSVAHVSPRPPVESCGANAAELCSADSPLSAQGIHLNDPDDLLVSWLPVDANLSVGALQLFDVGISGELTWLAQHDPLLGDLGQQPQVIDVTSRPGWLFVLVNAVQGSQVSANGEPVSYVMAIDLSVKALPARRSVISVDAIGRGLLALNDLLFMATDSGVRMISIKNPTNLELLDVEGVFDQADTTPLQPTVRRLVMVADQVVSTGGPVAGGGSLALVDTLTLRCQEQCDASGDEDEDGLTNCDDPDCRYQPCIDGNICLIPSFCPEQGDCTAGPYYAEVRVPSVGEGALTEGSVLINSVSNVASTPTQGDGVMHSADSAPSKVSALDALSTETGIAVSVLQTQLNAGPVGPASCQAGDIVINGVDLGAFELDINSPAEVLSSAFNAVSSLTGVQSIVALTGINLVAPDGRNIELTVSEGPCAEATHLVTQVARGGMLLRSDGPIVVDYVSSNAANALQLSPGTTLVNQDDAIVCDDDDPCTADSCDKVIGACSFVPLPGCFDSGGLTYTVSHQGVSRALPTSELNEESVTEFYDQPSFVENSCCEGQETAGCESASCQDFICQYSSWASCCSAQWTDYCASLAKSYCSACTGYVDPSGEDVATGYEVSNRVAVMIHSNATYGDSLIVTLDGPEADDEEPSGGSAEVTITGAVGTSLLRFDDEDDVVANLAEAGSWSVTWGWGPGESDGLALGYITSGVCISFDFGAVEGLDGLSIIDVSSSIREDFPDGDLDFTICRP